MDLARISAWRNWAGGVAAVLCGLLFLALADAALAHVRKSPFAFDLLPGGALKVSGPIPQRIRSIGELLCQTSSELLQVTLESVETGAWLGGRLWRGSLRLSPAAAPGSYNFMVKPRQPAPGEVFPLFVVTVHPDRAAYRRHSFSFFERLTGLSPWWIAAAAFPLAALAFLAVFCFSRWREGLLLRQGRAEVYHVGSASGAALEVAFGLGTSHGVRPGLTLPLLDTHGRPIGSVLVIRSSSSDSVATTCSASPVKPGYFVCLPGSMAPRNSVLG